MKRRSLIAAALLCACNTFTSFSDPDTRNDSDSETRDAGADLKHTDAQVDTSDRDQGSDARKGDDSGTDTNIDTRADLPPFADNCPPPLNTQPTQPYDLTPDDDSTEQIDLNYPIDRPQQLQLKAFPDEVAVFQLFEPDPGVHDLFVERRQTADIAQVEYRQWQYTGFTQLNGPVSLAVHKTRPNDAVVMVAGQFTGAAITHYALSGLFSSKPFFDADDSFAWTGHRNSAAGDLDRGYAPFAVGGDADHFSSLRIGYLVDAQPNTLVAFDTIDASAASTYQFNDVANRGMISSQGDEAIAIVPGNTFLFGSANAPDPLDTFDLTEPQVVFLGNGCGPSFYLAAGVPTGATDEIELRTFPHREITTTVVADSALFVRAAPLVKLLPSETTEYQTVAIGNIERDENMMWQINVRVFSVGLDRIDLIAHRRRPLFIPDINSVLEFHFDTHGDFETLQTFSGVRLSTGEFQIIPIHFPNLTGNRNELLQRASPAVQQIP